MPAENQTTLSLYVWEGVLTDYTSGMVVAVARSEVEARNAIMVRDETAAGCMSGWEDNWPAPTRVVPLNDETHSEAWVVWGGG